MPEAESKPNSRAFYALACLWLVFSQIWYYLKFEEPIRQALPFLRGGFWR